MPEVHVTRWDAVRYFSAGVFLDLKAAIGEGVFFKRFSEIISFRAMQYLGTYEGHNEHRRLSRAQKEAYFYPQPRKAAATCAEPALLRETDVSQRKAA